MLYSKRWYDKVPRDIHSLAVFASNSYGIISDLIKGKQVSFSFAQTETASVRSMPGNKRHITLPAFLFDFEDELYEGQAEPHYAFLSFLNGFLIHEGLHCLLSPASKEEFAPREIKDRALFYFCANIIEDIFIEHYAQEKNIPGWPFLDDLGIHFLKPAEKIDVEDGQAISNALITWKRKDQRNSPHFNDIPEHVTIMNAALDVDLSLSERGELAYQLYLLLEKFGNEINQSDMSEHFDEGKIIDELEDLPREVQEAIKIFEQEIEEHFKVKGEGAKEHDVEKVTHLTHPQFFRNKGRSFSKNNNPYRGFGNFLKSILTFNLMPFETKKHGNRLSKVMLSRHHSTENVFESKTLHDESENYNDIEIIILLDASGSMAGHLFEECFNASVSLFEEVRRAGIPIKLFGHTSSYFENGEKGFYYPIASLWGGVTEDHIEETKAVSHGANGDGFVIARIRDTEFSKKRNRKFLWVLSDGQPALDGYGGQDAILHTKRQAEIARQKGIEVISFSLIESVKEANDQIYGEGRNILLTQKRLNVLMHKMKQIIIRKGK